MLPSFDTETRIWWYYKLLSWQTKLSAINWRQTYEQWQDTIKHNVETQWITAVKYASSAWWPVWCDVLASFVTSLQTV